MNRILEQKFRKLFFRDDRGVPSKLKKVPSHLHVVFLFFQDDYYLDETKPAYYSHYLITGITVLSNISETNQL